MPDVVIGGSVSVHYEDECNAPPWNKTETILLINGAETGVMWRRWMPLLTPTFRVIRPDMRGYGRSRVPEPGPDSDWSPPTLAADIVRLLDTLGIERVHAVGSKYGSAVTIQLAVDHPQRVQTLALLSPFMGGLPTFVKKIGQMERQTWVSSSNQARYGSGVSAEEMAWWNAQMGSADERVLREQIAAAGLVDLMPMLPSIKVPTLLVTTDRNQKYPVERVLEWQRIIARADLLVLPSDGYNVGALRPEECAREMVAFIARHAVDPGEGAAIPATTQAAAAIR